jgi:hypothetical protein
MTFSFDPPINPNGSRQLREIKIMISPYLATDLQALTLRVRSDSDSGFPMLQSMAVKKGRHCAREIHYHVVFPVKYRNIMLLPEIVSRYQEERMASRVLVGWILHSHGRAAEQLRAAAKYL